jgi:hypothetical protein
VSSDPWSFFNHFLRHRCHLYQPTHALPANSVGVHKVGWSITINSTIDSYVDSTVNRNIGGTINRDSMAVLLLLLIVIDRLLRITTNFSKGTGGCANGNAWIGGGWEMALLG